jgi:hypothetical protein
MPHSTLSKSAKALLRAQTCSVFQQPFRTRKELLHRFSRDSLAAVVCSALDRQVYRHLNIPTAFATVERDDNFLLSDPVEQDRSCTLKLEN